MMRRVLVIGSGAREHALANALVAAGAEVMVAPGNGGTAGVARNVSVAVDDIDGLVELARRESVELVVVGPELPLVLGVADALHHAKVQVFGPSRAAARLEGSKAFMKEFAKRHAIPTAEHRVFDDAEAASAFVRAAGRALVVKTDGLASGKGVVVAKDTAEALSAVDRMMRRREFGDAGARVVIEELLAGEEASYHVVCDGERYVALAPAQDHKRVGDGDTGPNTGGMGAYAPAPIVTPEVEAIVKRRIIEPALAGMRAEGCPFRGVLFAGLMIDRGQPSLLEFNVRFGDPETSVLVPLYDGDWFELLSAAARGDLSAVRGGVRAGAALSVVMAAEGYPAQSRSGDVIEGLDAPVPEGAFVLHAGTRMRVDGAIETHGGRILNVGAKAPSLGEAQVLAYRALSQIHWPGEHHRHDIGRRALGV